MPNTINPRDAQAALGVVEQRRRDVIAEIDMPRWYWWGVALGWIALGVISDTGNAIASLVATLVFGTVHATLGQRVLSGRHRSNRLSVRADLVTRRLPVLIIGFLLAMVVVTVASALAINADGARHPGTYASVAVAVAVLCGGPQLTAAVRRRAVQ